MVESRVLTAVVRISFAIQLLGAAAPLAGQVCASAAAYAGAAPLLVCSSIPVDCGPRVSDNCPLAGA